MKINKNHLVKRLLKKDTRPYLFSLTTTVCKIIEENASSMEVSEALLIEGLIRSGLKEAVAYYKEQGFDSQENKRFKGKNRYKETKQHKTFSLTKESNKSLGLVAYKLGDFRSEVIECAVRAGLLAKAKEYVNSLLATY